MRGWTRRVLGWPLGALLVPAGCAGGAARYRLVTDPASRYSFKHVQEKNSKKWVHLHCELAVAEARKLPDPLSTPETGDLISFTRFDPGSMGSAGIAPAEFKVRGEDRVWLYREVAKGSDLDGKSALGVAVSWPSSEQGPRPHDPSEIFHIPSIATLEPYVWTPWRGADEVRGGDMPDWERVQGMESAAAPPVEHPFRLRCRTVLTDFLYIPIEAEDPNVTVPDPSARSVTPPSRSRSSRSSGRPG